MGLKEVDHTNMRQIDLKFSSDNQLAGTLFYLRGNTFNQKSKCSQHDHCVCWVTLRNEEQHGDQDLLFRAMLSWLSRRGVTRQRQLELAYDLKIRFGTKPKKNPYRESV